MPTNQTRRQLLERIKTSSFPGSIIDVFKAADQGVDLISQFEQQQQQEQAQQQMQQEQMQQDQGMQVANTPEEQEIGLREQHAMGNTDASMAFPNVQPGQSFNTVGMKAPIDIQKIDSQGHLVESYKNVPPGIQDLPTGPYEGTIIESPAAYQKGGVKKYPDRPFIDFSSWRDFTKSDVGRFVDAKGLGDMFDMTGPSSIVAPFANYYGYGKDDGTDFALDAAAIVSPIADFVHAGTKWNEGKYTDAVLYGGFGILPFTAAPLVKGTKKLIGIGSKTGTEKIGTVVADATTPVIKTPSRGTSFNKYNQVKTSFDDLITKDVSPINVNTGKKGDYLIRQGELPTRGGNNFKIQVHGNAKVDKDWMVQIGDVDGGMMQLTKNSNNPNMYNIDMSMASPQDAGQAMKYLEEFLPKGSILSSASTISLDSYKLMLNRIKRGKFSLVTDVVDNNNIKSAISPSGRVELNLLGKGAPNMINKVEADNLVIKINKMLKDAGVDGKARAFQHPNEIGNAWNIDMPDLNLKMEYRHGGFKTLTNTTMKKLKKGGLRKYQNAGVKNDPPTDTPTNLVPDPVIGNQMGLGFDFECDTSTGANCSNKMGRMFRLGLKGSLEGRKGTYGQPINLGPGWDPNTQQQVDNRIGTSYNQDITGNLGAYLRTDLQPLFFPNDITRLRGGNWEPWHLDLGYNRKQNSIGSMEGTGSNNLTAKLAKTRDQFYGSPGYGGFFGNKGGSSRPGYSYGLQANYNYDTKRLDNIGAFGRIGMMGPLGISGHAGINPQTGKPNFGANLSMKFKKGGVRKYQNGGVNSLGQGTGVDAEGGEISKDNQSALNWFEDYKKGDYFNTMTGNYPSLSFEGQDYTPQALEQIAEFGTKGQNQWHSTKLFQNPSKHGAYYHKGKINMPKGTRSSVLSHELGHTDNNWLSLPFQNWVGDHNLKLQSGAIQEGSHDARAHETRGDLTRLRYMMENANIFNSTGDFKTFTAEDYDKAYGQFGKLKNTDSRIFRMYSKEDVIWLMNNMANKTPQGGNPFEISDDLGGESQYMVKKGGVRKLNKRKRWL